MAGLAAKQGCLLEKRFVSGPPFVERPAMDGRAGSETGMSA